MIAQSPHARVRCHPGRIRFRYPPARFFASRRQTLERAASLRLPSSSRSLRVDCASPPPLPQRLSNALHHLTALVADSVEGVGWQSTRETSAKLIYRHEMGHAIMGMNLARTRNNTPDAGCARLTDSQTHRLTIAPLWARQQAAGTAMRAHMTRQELISARTRIALLASKGRRRGPAKLMRMRHRRACRALPKTSVDLGRGFRFAPRRHRGNVPGEPTAHAFDLLAVLELDRVAHDDFAFGRQLFKARLHTGQGEPGSGGNLGVEPFTAAFQVLDDVLQLGFAFLVWPRLLCVGGGWRVCSCRPKTLQIRLPAESVVSRERFANAARRLLILGFTRVFC